MLALKPVQNIDNIETLDHEGRAIAKKNPEFGKFAELLCHPEFSEFFSQNFASWEDCKQSIMLLKMGQELKHFMENSTGQEISGFQLAGAMKRAIDNSETRIYMVSRLKDFIQEPTQQPRIE